MPYMRPSVRAVIDPETLEEAVLSAVIKHLALGTAAAPQSTLIKKKRKFSSNIRKFRMEQLQSHIYEERLPNMRKYLPTYEAVSHI
jgi:hypothetical protein